MVWIFVMTPNFSYFVQLKNRYCYVKFLLSPTLDFLCFLWHWHHDWRSVRCIHLRSLSRHISWVVGDSFYNTIFEFYTRWQCISLTIITLLFELWIIFMNLVFILLFLNVWTLTFYCFRFKNAYYLALDFRVSNHCWAFKSLF